MEEIINKSIINLAKYFVIEQIPFTIVLDNHNTWDNELPERLSTQKKFLLKMQNTDLSDSYIDEQNNLIIAAGIDNNVYTKVLEGLDVHSIGLVDREPLIVKQFIEYPEVVQSKKKTKTDDEIEHSMSSMIKNNPSFFKKEKENK